MLLGEQGSGRERGMGALTRDVWKPRSLPLGTRDMAPASARASSCVCVCVPSSLLTEGRRAMAQVCVEGVCVVGASSWALITSSHVLWLAVAHIYLGM